MKIGYHKWPTFGFLCNSDRSENMHTNGIGFCFESIKNYNGVFNVWVAIFDDDIELVNLPVGSEEINKPVHTHAKANPKLAV